jgi:ATP-dependent exoDNAse (exonuclease V) alpha subunit
VVEQVVDEASMLSARDAEQVLARARNAEARLVLVGDVRQLGSVAAGRVFGQLQDDGMETPKLAEIVRQSNPDTRRAVEALLAGNAEAAFAALDDGGGEVIQHADHDVRRARLARDFARLSPRDRARTLVLDPTREGRQALTDAIRAELVRDGTLGTRAMTVTVLEFCGLTDAARARAASYRPGTVSSSVKVQRTARRAATPATASGPSTPRAAPSGCSTPRGRLSPGPPVTVAPPMPTPSPRSNSSSAPATRCSSPDLLPVFRPLIT